MGGPVLITFRHELGILHLQLDILVVGAEPLPCEASHILENEGSWLRLAYGPHRFREHVAPVSMRPVTTSDGEGLAGRTSRNQLDFPLMRPEVRVTDIALDIQWPSLGVALACATIGQ